MRETGERIWDMIPNHIFIVLKISNLILLNTSLYFVSEMVKRFKELFMMEIHVFLIFLGLFVKLVNVFIHNLRVLLILPFIFVEIW